MRSFSPGEVAAIALWKSAPMFLTVLTNWHEMAWCAAYTQHVLRHLMHPSIYYRQLLQHTMQMFNKFAQSNLGRGPRRGTVAHVRRKVPVGYNGAPQIRPQKYPFPWIDPQTPLPASSMDPSDLWCQTASGSDRPFFHNALDRQTHRRTYGPTHRQTDAPTDGSCTGKFDHYRPLRYETDAA